MQITSLLVLFVGVVLLAAPSFADYYKGPKYVPKPLYSKPPQVENQLAFTLPKWFPKKPPKLPKFKFSPPPPMPKRKVCQATIVTSLHHPQLQNAQNIKPNN
ncbi:hypothetical protein OIU79_007138 [Salix purpurea]|uniref:Uncharacterized protein n=1 Tax=Salix purpurea TaxID=77065 RepID=A0A9Q0TX46_SALPP|nr:hypothetical protein OIU79_007138 [Salix purpurea]